MRVKHHGICSVVAALICSLTSCNQKSTSSDLPLSDNKKILEVAKLPRERLLELVGTWSVIENSFISKEERNMGTMTCVPAANGYALSSTYSQGSGDSYYEANALWGYSETTKEVKVFEINSIGSIDTHNGFFDSTGLLLIALHDHKTHALLQYRTMSWSRDTLKMEAVFLSNQDTTKHKLIMTRQKK